ncbi:MAG: Mrp/NBP35 family ATP-binding protein [Bacillota bacterium]
MYELEDGIIKLNHGSIKEGMIAVASGKGGVGKSTATVNLAIALSKLGKKVGIIDADVHGFSIPRILGLEKSAKAISEEEIIPPEVNGIKVMSMGSFVPEENPVIWRAPLLLSALQQFMQDIHWGELDYLLFDLPPGTGDMALNIMQKLPHAELLIITTPQITAVNVAGRIGKVADKLNSEILGVIENMSYHICSNCGQKEYIFGQGGGSELADKLNTKLLGEIPLLSEVRDYADKGQSIFEYSPESDVTKIYMDIARKIKEENHEFDQDLKPVDLKGAK